MGGGDSCRVYEVWDELLGSAVHKKVLCGVVRFPQVQGVFVLAFRTYKLYFCSALGFRGFRWRV